MRKFYEVDKDLEAVRIWDEKGECYRVPRVLWEEHETLLADWREKMGSITPLPYKPDVKERTPEEEDSLPSIDDILDSLM